RVTILAQLCKDIFISCAGFVDFPESLRVHSHQGVAIRPHGRQTSVVNGPFRAMTAPERAWAFQKEPQRTPGVSVPQRGCRFSCDNIRTASWNTPQNIRERAREREKD